MVICAKGQVCIYFVGFTHANAKWNIWLKKQQRSESVQRRVAMPCECGDSNTRGSLHVMNNQAAGVCAACSLLLSQRLADASLNKNNNKWKATRAPALHNILFIATFEKAADGLTPAEPPAPAGRDISESWSSATTSPSSSRCCISTKNRARRDSGTYVPREIISFLMPRVADSFIRRAHPAGPRPIRAHKQVHCLGCCSVMCIILRRRSGMWRHVMGKEIQLAKAATWRDPVIYHLLPLIHTFGLLLLFTASKFPFFIDPK